ncbi:YueI family protein [Alkalicoccus chagannorensis]|uniref:YueI family protein n=1 Tax=Alkalicoccus chagannorensis TaxID=427072 RepID=UPI0003F50039|nr:YueI family protein [Alkalicoccus chagannorensis]
MGDDQVNKVLKEGILGKPELKADEKRVFLGNFAERVKIALTNGQVYKKGMYEEVVHKMKDTQLHLYINGRLPYQSYNNYVKEATKHGVPFTIHAEAGDTPVGLVLASDKPVFEQEKFIEDDIFKHDMEHSG